MTCRPMLWIAATTVALGTVASPSSMAAGAPDAGWNVTIDGPATAEVDSHRLLITGTAERLGLDLVDPPTSVTVTVVPQGLPEACGPLDPGVAGVAGGRYEIGVDVRCNGPHQVQVVAHAALGTSGGPATRDVGVAEPPATPDAPGLDLTPEDGLAVTWVGTDDIDAVGWVLKANYEELTFDPGVTATTLPPAHRRSSVSVRAVRWGAGGPGTTVMSEYSMGNLVGTLTPPPDPDPPDPDPDPDSPTPDPEPSPPDPAPSPNGPTGPSGPNPPGTNGGTPTRGTGAPSTTLPAGYSEELPFGAPDKAFVPGSEPNRRPSSDAEERAVASSAPVGGLVRTTEKRSPGLVAPFALGLLMLTIAVHIAWYLRRSRPTSGGQVRLS